MIDWQRYNAYFNQIETNQEPMSHEIQVQIDDYLRPLLNIEQINEPVLIGEAYGFGNYTEVIIKIHNRPVDGEIGEMIPLDFTGEIAIRVLRADNDGEFFRERANQQRPLNNTADGHFQRTFGVLEGNNRTFVVQEWVPGETIEWLRNNSWNSNPLNSDNVQKIIRQIVQGIIVPAWAIATAETGVLWDIRDANFVISNYEQVDEQVTDGLKVKFVDIDNLRHVVEPAGNRIGQITQALRRLKKRVFEILKTDQGNWPNRPRNFKARFDEAYGGSEIENRLRALADGGPNDVQPVNKSLDQLIQAFEARGLLRP